MSKPLPRQKKLIPISEAAKVLGVSIDTIRRWDKSGILNSERPDGKNRYFSVEELEKIKFSQPLSISEAAGKLGISTSTLRRLDSKGLIKPERNSNGERVYTKQSLESFLKSEYFLRQRQVEEKILEPLKQPLGKGETEEKVSSDTTHKVLAAIQHENVEDISKLNKFKNTFYTSGLFLVTTFILIVGLITAYFLLFPEDAARFFGYNFKPEQRELPLLSDGTYTSAEVEQIEQVLGEKYEKGPPQPSDSVGEILKPFSRLSLGLVKQINPQIYYQITPTQEIADINEIFTIDEEGNIVPLYDLKFKDSSSLLIPDSGMIANLNSEWLRGKGPSDGEGDLVVYDKNNKTISNLIVTNQNFESSTIEGAIISDLAITTEKIADGAITSAKLASEVSVLGTDSVTSSNIKDGEVKSVDILDGAVDSAEIADGTIATADLADGVVTAVKIADNTITANDLSASITLSDGDFLDLSAIVHDDTAPQGLRLPNASSASPSFPSSGEGYLAWDTSGNQLVVYDGSSWATVTGGGGGSGDITEVVAGDGLTGGATSGSATLNIGAGTGITVAADSISATLGTSIDTTEIDADTITLSNLADSLTLDSANITFASSDLTNDYKIIFDNSSTGDIATLVEVTTSGTGSTIGVALDLDDADISTAIALGSNDISVGGATISSSEFALLDSGITLSELTDSGTLTATTVDINGGAIDGTAIGASSASTGAFTTLSASSTLTANGILDANGQVDLGDGGDSVTVNGNALTLQTTGAGSDITINAVDQIILTDFANCTALETSSGVLTCGTDDTAAGGAGTLQETYAAGATISVTSGEGALAITGTSANVDFVIGGGTDTGDFRIYDGTDNWLFIDESADTLAIGTAAGSGITIGGTGITTTNSGALTVTQTLTANGTFDSNGEISIADTNIAFDGASTTFTTTGAFTLTPGGAVILGDGGDTMVINTSDWDIDATGAITGVSFDANGTGNSISNIENADLTNDTVDLDKIADTLALDGDLTLTAGAAEDFIVNKSYTDATSENGLSFNFTALDTSSGTTAQYGLYLDNAASTEGLDAALVIDNSDADDSVGAAIKIIDAGGTFTSIIDNAGVLISGAELNRLDGKDANLVDTNDAVSTAIVGTGTLTSGATGAGFTINFGTSTLSGNIGTSNVAGLDISDDTNLSASDGITLTGDALTNSDKGSSQNIFKTIAVSGQSNVVTDTNSDTLTFIAGTNITLTTDATNDTVTITAVDTNTTYSAGNDLDLTGTTFSLETTLDFVDTINLAGTGTLNGLDVIDDTTETTIEGAIDTLANLTTLTIGGDTITEFVGTGLTLSGSTLTTTLGTAIDSTEITDNEITASDLAATLTFADGDYINLAAMNQSTTLEGLRLPQATDCSTNGTVEGVICWDSDNDTLYLGNGSTATAVSNPFGSAIDSSEITDGTITADDLGANSVDDSELVDTLSYTGALTLTQNLNANGGMDVDDAFVVADGGAVSTISISDTNVPLTGSSFTFDFNNASDRTLTIANSGDGTANLAVDGTISQGGTTLGATYAPINANFVTVTANATLTGETGIDALSTAISTTSTLNVDGASTLAGVTLDANADFTLSSGTGSVIVTNSVSNASDQVLDLNPAFAGGAADTLTYTVIDIAAFTPTNAAGTDAINGVSIGNLTQGADAARLTTTALLVGSGWDNALSVGGTAIINGSGVLQSDALSGTYSNTLTLSGASNAITAGTLTATGGTINGVIIGGSTPAAGTFTTLTANGDVTMNDAGADTILIGAAADTVTITANTLSLTDDNWSITAAGVLTVASCTGCTGGVTLDTAYTAGNTITTDSGSNVIITLQNVATPTSFTIENQDTAGVSAQRIFNTIASGTLTNGLLIENTDAGGTMTNAINILQTAGTITNAINANGTAISLAELQILDANIALTSEVTGVLPIANGGTNKALTLAAGAVVWTDADSFEVTAAGNSGECLKSGGTTTPTWGTCASSQTPWTSDIDADNFSLLDLGTNITARAELTIATTTTGALTLDSGTTGNINLGTGANGKVIAIGNSTANTSVGITTGGTGDLTVTTGDDILLNPTDDVILTAAAGTRLLWDGTTTDSTENTSATAGVLGITIDDALADTASGVQQGLYLDFQVTGTADANAMTHRALRVDYTKSEADGADTDQIVSIVNQNDAANGVTDAALVIDNAETTAGTLTDAILITSSGVASGIADAIDVSADNIDVALRVNANDIVGTTGVINYTNFDVDAAGNITVAAAEGLDTNGAGALELGKANATSVDICNSANCDTINIGNLATTDADAIVIGDVLDNVAITGDQWSITDAGALTVVSCTGCTGGVTLDTAYTAGNTIGTDSGSNVIINLAEVATPTELTINNLDTAGTNAVQIDNSIASGTLTNGLLLEQSDAGTMTNAIQVLGTAGTIANGILIADGAGAITDGIEFTGTFTNIINAPNFDVNNAGNITVAANEGLDTSAAGLLEIGITNANAITISKTGVTTTVAGALSVSETLGVTGISTLTGNLNANGGLDVDDAFVVADGGALTTSQTATFNGNVVIGNANTDTLTINAGTSGTGISFGDSSFGTCTALETVGGVLTCGSDAGGATAWNDIGDPDGAGSITFGDGETSTFVYSTTAGDQNAWIFDFNQVDDANATDDFDAMRFDLTSESGDAGDTFDGLVINWENGTANTIMDSAIKIDNAETTASTMTDAIIITSSGANGGVVDALDVSAANITTALRVDANAIEATELDFNIAPTGSTSSIGITTDNAAEDFFLDLTGATDSSLVLRSSGTGADAMQITTTAGGLDISVTGTADGEDLDLITTAATTEIRLTSASTEDDAITLTATPDTAGVHILAGDGEVAAVGTDEAIELRATSDVIAALTAGGSLVVDGDTTNSTNTDGALDINVGTVTTGVSAVNLTLTNDDEANAADTLYGMVINIDDNATQTDDTVYGLYIDSLDNGASDPDQVAEALIALDNSDATAADLVDDGIVFIAGSFANGIDMSGADITVADIVLEQGETIDNLVDGTIALGASTVTTSGALTITGALAGVTTIAASGDIAWTATTPTITINSTETFTVSDGTDTFSINHNGNAFSLTSGSNGITFDADGISAAAPVFSGAARPTKTITLNAEYSGAVLTTFYGAGTDTNVTGFMTSDIESTSPSTLKQKTYYHWERTTDATLHYYTVAVRVRLPKDFHAWTTANALDVDFVTDTTGTTANVLDVRVYLETDTTTAVASSTGNASGTADTWTTVTIDDSTLDDGADTEWDAADETAVIYLRMGSASSEHVRVGDIRLNYLAAF